MLAALRLSRRTAALLIPFVFLAGCSEAFKSSRHYKREEATKDLAQFETVGLVIGDFPIDGAASVVDGDTIRVKGLQSTLRLICIDTEETFKHEEERRAYASQSFADYVKNLRGASPRPVKMATPAGDDAKKWAQAFFDGVTTVRLERDHPGEIRDYYGRYLAYVFVQKDGKWVNYNLEAVRAGWAPYFTKYGESRRFHQQFVDAQAQAQAAKLHIWSDNEQHYPDYPERLAWWNARGAQVMKFERESEGDPSKVILSRWDAMRKLDSMAGKEVTILGAVSDVKLGDKGPSVVKLSRSRGIDFDLVFFDKDTLMSSKAIYSKGEFITAKGIVSKRLDRNRGTQTLQMIINLPSQVQVPPSAHAPEAAVGGVVGGPDVHPAKVKSLPPPDTSDATDHDDLKIPEGILGPENTDAE